MSDPLQPAVRAKLQAWLYRMSPEGRKRAIQAAKARMKLISLARQVGFPVQAPEQIVLSLKS